MKKLFLTMALVCVIGSVMAKNLQFNKIPIQPDFVLKDAFKQKKQSFKPLTRAENDKVLFGYSSNPTYLMGLSEVPGEIGGAMYIPEEYAQAWKGNRVNSILVCFGISKNPEVTVFITTELGGDPIYEQTSAIADQQAWNTIELDSPYTITGEPFYVGYTTNQTSLDEYPLVIDETEGFENGDFWGLDGEWDDYVGILGNPCIKMELTGDNLPQYSADMSDMIVPEFVAQNQDFPLEIFLNNTGVKSIKNITADVYVNQVLIGNFPGIFEAEDEEGLPSGYSGWFLLEGVKCPQTGINMEIIVDLKTIEDQKNEAFNYLPLFTYFSCSDVSYPRNVVIEEYTGTWCGWCPRGIVGMNYMKEKYPDTFIGIAVHFNIDPMACSTYREAVSLFDPSGAAPYAVIDRYYYFDPSAETMDFYYNYQRQFPTYGSIDVKAEYNDETNTIDVRTTSEFAFDIEEGNYGVALVVMENNVGPYPQTNNYAGGANGPMEGWGSLPGTVMTTYNEVARYINAPFGVEGSIPLSVEKSVPYEYTESLDINAKWKLQDCEVVALLLDLDNYIILNAAKTEVSNLEAGVEGIEADSIQEVYKVYNTQGVKVLETRDRDVLNTLPGGIYIVNGKKVVL